MKDYSFKLPKSLDNLRLDKALCLLINEISRSVIQKTIKDGYVKVNQVIISDPNTKVKENDIIILRLQDPKLPEMQAANIKLDIIFEDDDLMVINKPAGLTVHPGAGNHNDTLVNALLYYSNSLSDIGGTIRPGIVHRLDKDTSGLMVVAKNNIAHARLANQIEKRHLVRKYKAMVWGVLNPPSGMIQTNIGRSINDRKKMTVLKFSGKNAITYYNTEHVFLSNLISLVECKLETGKTHQIRVHLSHKGHSIVGDQTYGHNSRKINNVPMELQSKLAQFKRQALHSWYISFNHPITAMPMEFKADLPADIKELIELI